MESYEIFVFFDCGGYETDLRGCDITRPLRIRYKDEVDGGYVNLNVDYTDNFQEMFVRARSVDEGIYRKILLRVSELDSPAVLDVTKTGNGEWGMGNGEWGMGNEK